MAITTQMRTEVSQLYVALFGRAPDGDGLGFWVQLRDQGQTMAQIANTMYSTTPARTYFPSFLTNTEIISAFYTNVLGRTADADGLAFWTGKLNAAGATPGSVIAEMISVVAGYTGTDAAGVISKDLFNNKVSVAQYYGEKNGTVAGATTVLTGVTNVAATVTTTKAAIDAGTVGGVNQGQTFTLTSSTDSLVGTNGNDTFVAGTQAGNNTLNAGDSLTGGAGTDTLNIFAGGAALTTATITGIEIINVSEDISFDVSANTGVQQAWSIGGAGKTVTAALTQTVGFANTTTGGAATATFNGAAGAADSATIAVNDAGKTTAYTSVTVANIETLTVSAAGTNQLGTLTAAAAGKLVFTGAGSVTATLSDTAAYKTIDGSAATGALSLDASGATASAQVLDIKTGTANDTYTTLYANITTADKIDLGAGTDTLAFGDATVLNSAAAVAVLAGVTNVETLRVNGANAFTVDADLVAQANFRHNSTGVFTGTNFSNTDKLIVGNVDTGNSTVAMKLGQNTFNLDLAGGATAAADASTLTVTGATIVNVNSTGTAGVANNNLALTTDSNGTINITGSQNITVTTTLPGGATTGLTVNAATFTGRATVTGTGQADAITGGTGADTIRGGDGTDSVTGGAGADTFVFALTENAGADGAAVADIITDFVVGTDKLQFTAADVVSLQQAAVQAAVTALASTATEAQIATAMANANTTNLGVSFAVFGGNTYVYLETTGATTTHVEADNLFIKLTGVTTAPTYAADVTA